MDDKVYIITLIIVLLNGINTGIHGVFRVNLFTYLLHYEKLYFTLFTLVGFATAYLLFQHLQDLFMPFLGRTITPLDIYLDDKHPDKASYKVEIDSLPKNAARIIYWAAQPSNEVMLSWEEAYGNLENSGVKKVEDGKATFWIHEPGQFQIPLKGVLPKCIHYRIIYDDDIVSSSINTMRLKKMS